MDKEETKIEGRHLTETSLEEVLKQLFPESQIVAQFKHVALPKRKIDYAVHLDSNGIAKMQNLIKSTSSQVTLLIEFDGYKHYCSERQIEKDDADEFGNCHWLQVLPDGDWEVDPSSENLDYVHSCDPDSAVCECDDLYNENKYGFEARNHQFFSLRIPYFIQLDSVICKHWFNDERDFSRNYPHGFVSKVCALPEQFCRSGERRFLDDMCHLPKKVQISLFNSLFSKAKKKSIRSVASYELFKDIFKIIHPELAHLSDPVEFEMRDDAFYYKDLLSSKVFREDMQFEYEKRLQSGEQS